MPELMLEQAATYLRFVLGHIRTIRNPFKREMTVTLMKSTSVCVVKQAVNNPEFRANTQRQPLGVSASPHFQKLAVPGICLT